MPADGGAAFEDGPRLYRDLAAWWPLVSPPEDYVAETADFLARLRRLGVEEGGTLLELGSGGGSFAAHLKRTFRLTLTDVSPAMLAINRSVNPECEHILGDMRMLRLGRRFDVVLIHDAIVYATTPAAAREALHTAAVHCRPGGIVAVLPDHVRETFEPGVDHGGHDAADGRGVRFLEWTWDPDPGDDTYLADYAFLLRDRDGAVRVEHDRHIEGLFSRSQWLEWMREAGVPASGETDAWRREVFLGVRR
jgi:SAM-dependent methyltransferase